jgi:flagellar hook assembly protein FlgD
MNKHEEDYNNLIPAKPSITASYPNPFNPTTTIAYYIPVKSKVDMAIYNVKGQRVKDLINNEIPKGSHRIVWDGKDNNGRAVSSGLYLVRIGIGNKVDTHKVMMLK